MPTPNVEALFARLSELEITTRTVEHPPVFTVDEAQKLRGDLEGSHIKNLFLRNKKGKMWLVVTPEETPLDLKALGKRIGAGNLSFGSPERLGRYLGVEPGSVTPFAVINDRDHKVQVVLDDGIFARDPIWCHPLVNTRTTAIAGQDLLRFLEACGHEPHVLPLETS